LKDRKRLIAREHRGCVLIAKFWTGESGATGIEYGLAATAMPVAVIPVINGMGTRLRTMFSTISTAIK